MTITLAGVLPVSAVNTGLTASLPGLSAEVSKLTADISGALQSAIQGQILLAANFPPDPATLTAAIAAHLTPAAIAASFALMPTASVGVNLDLVAQLGIVTGQIAVVNGIIDSLSIGLGASGIAGWSYAGRAAGFGTQLEIDTVTGFGRSAPTAQIRGLVIASESFGSWQSFSRSARTNAHAAPAVATDERLAFLGELSGSEWNSGTASLFARIQLFLDELRAAKLNLENLIQVSLGLNLPDVPGLVTSGLSVVADLGITGLIGNLVTVHIDIAAIVGGIQAQIDALVSLTGDINAQLSAGGLAFWSYSGTAGDFGSSLRGAIQNGVPGGNGANAVAYGLALAGSASSMSSFGSVFKTS